VLTSNPGHCLWTGIIDEDKAGKVVRRLLEPDMWTGWGIRTLSSDNPAYNPHSYQRGSVWPHDNGIIAAGMKRYGFAAEANQVACGIFDAANRFLSHRLPEVFAGLEREAESFPVQYRGANTPQAWAAGSIFQFFSAILGFQPDAAGGKLWVHPTLPDWLPEVELHGLNIGQATLDIAFRQEGGNTWYEFAVKPAGKVEGDEFAQMEAIYDQFFGRKFEAADGAEATAPTGGEQTEF
jgi:glycogen debranching enzyme